MAKERLPRSGARPGPEASRASGIAVLAGALVTAALAAPGFLAMRRTDEILTGPGVTRTLKLSDYFGGLAGTPGDTPVYVLQGRGPGGTIFIAGGTHGDEIAGYLAAVALVEQARVTAGRLIVLPRANASGFTHNVPQEGHPQWITIPTRSGLRRFAYGARVTNPVHQWPDPQVYTLPGSGQELSGIETRNLNRCYPGRENGSITERIAYAVTSLIRQEGVDLAIDLHEASPEYPVVNTIVAHERATDLAALVNMNLQAEGIAIGLEESPRNLHGLSHREWGDATPALAVLMETTDPAQGRLRGRTDEALVVAGRDHFYVRASERHKLSVPFMQEGWPLDVRVARHLAGIAEFARCLEDVRPGKGVTITGVPGYKSLVAQGLSSYLR